MRVLLVHNRYRSSMPSGENRVVEEEAEQLRDAGHDVALLVRDSDSLTTRPLGAAAAAPGPVYSVRGVHDFRARLRSHRSDVVHLHNVYPLISPWVVRAAHAHGVPVVQTVHNYRHLCVKGTLFRDGRPCEDCLGRRVGWPGVAHACYRSSRPQSLAMVAGQAVHRDTWRSVDRLLPVSAFVARKLVEGGFSMERITVRHQGIQDSGTSSGRGSGAVFVGRLDEEKGLPELLAAWESLPAGRTLTLVGDGPLRAEAERAAARLQGLVVLGPQTPAGVRDALARSAFLVLPSRTYEGLPRVVIEAFMMGRPVLASGVGALCDLVRPEVGWLAPPTPSALAGGLQQAFDASDLAAKGRAARRLYLQEFTAEVSLRKLEAVYAEVVRAQAGRKGG